HTIAYTNIRHTKQYACLLGKPLSLVGLTKDVVRTDWKNWQGFSSRKARISLASFSSNRNFPGFFGNRKVRYSRSNGNSNSSLHNHPYETHLASRDEHRRSSGETSPSINGGFG